jgi:regulator of protease activity HflC (stomatin/prohibitin superfamily)
MSTRLTHRQPPRIPVRTIRMAAIALVLVLVVAPVATRFFRSVPAGHVAVATLFGKIQEEPYDEGLHILLNPFLKFNEFDARQDTHKEVVQVPSQDQLTTTIEVSVQYRLDRTLAPLMLRDTGLKSDMIRVHLVPKVRSVLREQGKSVEKAENFFLEETQRTIQEGMRDELVDYSAAKGIIVEAVLLRDITLPPFITAAIESKKEREQEVEKQKAELERFRTEQEQKMVQAEAERRAAEEEAERRRVLADARAYEIEKINAAIASNPAYIKLQALEALEAISGDPAAKIYFLNGDSPMPLPLMHLGEGVDPTGG